MLNSNNNHTSSTMISNNQEKSKDKNHELYVLSEDDNKKDLTLEEMYRKHLRAKDHDITIEELLESDEQTLRDGGIYLFGYGSLIWKADFQFSQKYRGYIQGYKRRFWQISRDHRGNFEFPGRVLTVVTEADYRHQILQYGENSKVAIEEKEFDAKDINLYGMCYLIPRDIALQTFKLLDYREKGGYFRTLTTCYLVKDDNSIEEKKAILYVGSTNTHENTEFIGPSVNGLVDDAAIIYKAIGPSGKNSEYLFQLTERLRSEFGECETYLTTLEKTVKSFIQQERHLPEQ
ncbi:hypothetical protein C9374_002083 [Naegleria lovaniensis]|uniref:glutathione-specific gamma-glutamylcyclotransferase n=1 Tax=Naegleria lovaniensis TaxID=51637 RepID=A0AA88GVF2_NAELO|nr:uncharacterized protein C9374_002083 [Naegleria lovaniensis]KAG2387048.1 hypothetical protein C9374_002083 [Naegleria lovaniensis]